MDLLYFFVTHPSDVSRKAKTILSVVYSITSQSGPTQLSVIMDTAVSVTATRAWKIRIYQIGCGSDSLGQAHTYAREGVNIDGVKYEEGGGDTADAPLEVTMSFSYDTTCIAPVGCLQYFTAVSGEISSFNYKSTVVDTNSNLLSNLNYAICIRVANGYCGIRYRSCLMMILTKILSADDCLLLRSRYSQVTSDPNSFTISEDVRGSPPVPIDVKLGYDQCTTDYLLIPGGSADGTLNAFSRDRFCGLALGPCVETGPTTCSPMIMAVTCKLTSITTCTDVGDMLLMTSFALLATFLALIRPFSVHVVTDGTTNIATRGFRLNYDQTPCLFG